MARVALLIGIGDYRSGLESISASSKDAAAFSHVLRSPQLGFFESSKVLTEAEVGTPIARSHIEEALEEWCQLHQPDDLAILYFSGYVLWDGVDDVYFAAHNTCDEHGRLVRSRAVSLSFVRSCLQDSAARHRLVIIDGCILEKSMNHGDQQSGQFSSNQPSQDSQAVDSKASRQSSLDFERHLGGESCVILAATHQTNYSPAQKKESLSTYTRFCIDGIRSGLADTDRTGHISPRAVHDYVKKQMAIATPAITPILSGDEDLATSLTLSKSQISEAQRDYCDAVHRLLQRHGYEPLRRHLDESSQDSSCLIEPVHGDQNGKHLNRSSSRWSLPQPHLSVQILEHLQYQFGLRHEIATELRTTVLGSHEQFRQSLSRYRDQVAQFMRQEESLLPVSSCEAHPSQSSNGRIPHSDAGYSEYNGATDKGFSESQNSLEALPVNPVNAELGQFDDLRDRLGLREQDVATLNQGIAYVQHLQQFARYRHTYQRAVHTEGTLDEAQRANLKELQELLHLSDEDVQPVEQELTASNQVHQQKLEHYRTRFSDALRQGVVQHSWIREALKRFQHALGLSDADVERIETEVQHHMTGSGFFSFNPEPDSNAEGDRSQRFQERLQEYRQAYANAIRQRIPIPSDLQAELAELQQNLQLSNAEVKPIQQEEAQKVRAEIQERLRNLDEYQRAFEQSVEESFPISAEERERLDSLCQSLNLTPEEVKPIEEMVEHQWQLQHRAEAGAPHVPFEEEDRQAASDTSSPNGLNPSAEDASTAAESEIDPDLNGSSAPTPSSSHLPTTEIESAAKPAVPSSPNQESVVAPSSLPSADESHSTPQSERNIDYSQLENYLKNKQWLDADEETHRILVTLGKSDSHTIDWLDQRAIANLPATDLHTIDRLWVQYSQGKFGFSVQSDIYFSSDPNRPIVNGNPMTFGKQVDWVQLERGLFGFKFYNQLKFQFLRAPRGHLPAKWFWDIPWWESLRLGGIGTGRGGCGNDDGILFSFMSKLVNCGVAARHRQP